MKALILFLLIPLSACNSRTVHKPSEITVICDSPKTMADCYKAAESDCFGNYEVTHLSEGVPVAGNINNITQRQLGFVCK